MIIIHQHQRSIQLPGPERNNFSFLYCIFLLVLFWPVNINAQTESEEKLEILNADTTSFAKTQRGVFIELIGNVHLRQGEAQMFCGRAEYWKDIHEAIIHDEVRIYEKGKQLVADKVFYYDIPQIFKAIGNVVIKDSMRQIMAKQVTYYRAENRIEADNKVIMKDSINYVEINGEQAEFDNNKDYAFVTGAPVLVKKDSTGEEEIRITGLKMELFDGGDKAVVTDSVNITQNKVQATCGRAEFYRQLDEIILDQNPIAWQDTDQISGELIHLFIKDRKLVTAIVKNEAKLTSRVDTTGTDQRMNILMGQQITAYFKNEELEQIEVDNRATSYYNIFENNEYKGLNKIIGDKIIVFLKDRGIERIVVESSPQLSAGVYYPPGQEPEQKEFKD